MKKQVAAALKGFNVETGIEHLFDEYCIRKRLSGIGYIFDGNKIEHMKAEYFAMFDAEIEIQQNKLRAKNNGKRRN